MTEPSPGPHPPGERRHCQPGARRQPGPQGEGAVHNGIFACVLGRDSRRSAAQTAIQRKNVLAPWVGGLTGGVLGRRVA